MYAASAGLKTVFGHHTPCINGKTVYYPALPIGEVDEDTTALFEGWCVHETLGHGRFTDFNYHNSEEIQDKFKANKNLHGMTNAIEDPRIEVKGITFLPGTDAVLRKRLKVMLSKNMVRDGSKSPSDALQMFVCHWGRIYLLGHEMLQGVYETAKHQLEQSLGTDGLEQLTALLKSEFPFLKSTADSLGLAEKVLALVEDVADEQDEPEQDDSSQDDTNDDETGDSENDDGESGDDESGDEGDDSESGSNDESDEGEEDTSGSAGGDSESDEEEGDTEGSAEGDSKSDDDSSESETNEAGNGGDKVKGSGAREILDGEPENVQPIDDSEALQGALEEEDTNARAKGETPSYYDGNNEEECEAYESAEMFHAAHEAIGSQVATIQHQLVSLLSAQSKSSFRSSTRGRIKGRALHRAMVNNPCLFRKKQTQEAPTSAVSILIDLSGSMSSMQLSIAQMTAIAVAEACNALDVPLEVYGFGGRTHDHVEVKSFEMDYSQGRSRLGGFTANAGGGTPMGESMYNSAQRLVMQDSDKKTMIVLTDGVPNSVSYAQEVIEMMEDAEFNVFGVGIQTTAVQGVFPQCSVVTDINSLSSEVLNMLQSALAA
jgi:cobalamin biosynthesis protein CobT